ncbi:hypothetical protein BK120_14955 [Paenibacillus sp. FSL A5-0031]|uniref:hypothetical protein n=1 Tax=Paenibacillus sp. FSL A5-0031 TaxID=1920420 RepID=UPI00096DBFE0|nr:hypothetical protein [Paenibacillus sp. FSL A5-0031]OME83097.1 hypothetical protein BK120_14955 [Paenibacillus sp. FSL A5-0031]
MIESWSMLFIYKVVSTVFLILRPINVFIMILLRTQVIRSKDATHAVAISPINEMSKKPNNAPAAAPKSLAIEYPEITL